MYSGKKYLVLLIIDRFQCSAKPAKGQRGANIVAKQQ
jgi:hypothetical protein